VSSVLSVAHLSISRTGVFLARVDKEANKPSDFAVLAARIVRCHKSLT
jgi:hypothetical protein